jgi:DNA-binding HxlR family transcriptional regulator
VARRAYGQYCGLARALELVGERWALLIVRELLARPSRYTDLLEDLPGIPTNVLSTRLKELEEAGIAERRIAPAPQRGVVYALTADGQRLESAVLALAGWGTAHLGEQQHGDIVPPSSVAMGLRAMFKPDAVSGLSASWEVHTGGAVLHAVVADGHVTTGVGPAPGEADLVITIASDQMPSYRTIMQAIESGAVETVGRRELLDTFVRAFSPAS